MSGVTAPEPRQRSAAVRNVGAGDTADATVAESFADAVVVVVGGGDAVE